MDHVRNGPHDLGGAAGFGPIDVGDEREAAYPEGWEGRCVAAIIATLAGGHYNVDQFRARIEELPPAAHFAMGYYRRWLHGLERNLLVNGVLDAREISARAELLGRAEAAGAIDPEASAVAATAARERLRRDPALLARIESLLREGGPLLRAAGAPPRFRAGDRVRTREVAVERLGEQHTRLPGYAQRRRGTVVLVHPPMVLPDASVAGEERAEHLYAVAFAADELWPDGEPGVRVSADLFESYVEAEEE